MVGAEVEATVSSRALWPLVRGARARGASEAALLDGLIDRGQFWEPALRVSHREAIALGRRAIEATASVDVLLLAHEYIEPGDFDVLAYAGRCSATLADSLRVSDRYIRLMHDAVSTTLSMSREHGAWRFEFDTAEQPRVEAYGYLMGLLAQGGSHIIGTPRLYSEVRFRAPAPPSADVFERAWGVPVHFAAGENAVVFPRDVFDQPLSGADPNLHRILSRHADRLLEELPALPGLSTRLRQLLSDELGSGDTSLSHAAKRMGMAPSTLRRHLKRQGTTHRELLDELRLQRTLAYLKDPELSVSEIAFLLGFSQVSAFDRAFKRWTGKRPGELRRKH